MRRSSSKMRHDRLKSSFRSMSGSSVTPTEPNSGRNRTTERSDSKARRCEIRLGEKVPPFGTGTLCVTSWPRSMRRTGLPYCRKRSEPMRAKSSRTNAKTWTSCSSAAPSRAYQR